jgi:hypothetical protein
MNITSAGLYWLTRVDPINTFAQITIWLLVAGLIVAVCITFTAHEGHEGGTGCESVVKLLKKLKWFILLTGCPVILTLIFLPTTKELAVILVAPVVMNNADVQKIPVDILKLASQELDKLLEIKEGKTK